MKTAKKYLHERGINPEQPVHWFGGDEYYSLENIMRDYALEVLSEFEASIEKDNSKM